MFRTLLHSRSFLLLGVWFAFGLAHTPSVLASEAQLDTGVIRIGLGKAHAGFIDEAYFDRNGDGVYAPDELIVRQPDNEPALIVSYLAEELPLHSGVATGSQITGKPTVDSVEIRDLKAVIKGQLHFELSGTAGTPTTSATTQFELSVEGKRNSAVLKIDFDFEPLKDIPGLLLKEASLRIYGVFDQRDPGQTRRSMSTGDFRNTPRPDSAYQPLVWQLGGHLVESPWHWRNWLSWSDNTAPVTLREGGVPPKELNFFMRDDRHGIQASIMEPAGAAPFELFGNALPTNLGLFVWSPRVPPLAMRADLPERIEIKGIGLHFFRSGVEGLFNKSDAYWKKLAEVVPASQKEIAQELQPVQSTLTPALLGPEQLQQRLRELAVAPVRGWSANVLNTAVPDASFKPSERPDSGKGWVAIDIDPTVSSDRLLPVKGGIPFPRGVLDSSDNLRLVNANGEELPIQADRLAVWPDGSVKWVLITLLAGDPKVIAPLRLEYGAQVVRNKSTAPGALKVVRTPDGLSVETGSLHFTLSKKMTGLFDNVRLTAAGDGKQEQAIQLVNSASDAGRPNRMDLLALASPAAYAPYSFHAEGAQPEPSRAVIEDIRVEREGPLVAHLLVKGRYHYATLGRGRGNKDNKYRNEGCEFWIRYTVFAGQSYVEVKHSFVFEGNPDLEMIRELSLSVPVEFTGKTLMTVGADGKGMTPFPATRAGIVQDNPYAAEVWSADGGKERTLNVPGVADGWSDVSDSQKGVTFGLRNMREMFAKELSLDDGSISVGLWPKRARLLDTRRYARQYVDGESTSFGQGAAQGVSRSHDLFFYFHAGDAVAADSAEIARHLLKPAVLKALPAWYASSQAAGPFRPRDAKAYASWENMLTDGIDYFLYHRQLWSWFGIYDYGDLQQVPNGRGGWERLSGRWGWVNNEALVDMLLYEQFMRTGKRDYLDAALAMTRHTQEVDLINSHDYKGNRQVKMHGHRHNVDHWGDGYVGIRGAAPQGFRLGYFLTGDLRIYDQLHMGMDAHWESTNSFDKEHSSGLGYLSFFWEATGEPIYRDALTGYLDFQMRHVDTFGHLHNGVWNFRKDADRPLPAGQLSEAPTGFFFQNFGSAYALMELADLTGRKDLVEALIQFARDTMQQRGKTWEALYCHYRLMAFAYRHSGDPVFLRYASEHASKLAVAPNRQTWHQRSAIDRFDNKLSMLAWAGQGLPYLMQAMDERARDPVVSFSTPSVLALNKGETRARLAVDGSEARAREGALTEYSWQVDGAPVSDKVRDELLLSPGKHRVSLVATDSAKRSALSSRTVTVWPPGVIARLCFRGNVTGFVGGEYSDATGYGYTRGTRIADTSEPQRHGKMGCPEVRITGGVRVKTGTGRFEIEMGGTDFWTETMGKVSLQNRTLDLAIVKAASKKLSWSHTGEVAVGPDGMLTIDFVPGPKGEPVVLAYIIVREKP